MPVTLLLDGRELLCSERQCVRSKHRVAVGYYTPPACRQPDGKSCSERRIREIGMEESLSGFNHSVGIVRYKTVLYPTIDLSLHLTN